MDAARTRLSNERKDLQTNRPLGCFLKPRKLEDGSIDLFLWEGGIKPLPSSAYALPDDGAYSIRIKFKSDFPSSPPEVSFLPPIFHTNCFPDGRVCLSLLLQQGHHPGAGHKGFWQATLRLGDILRALQTYLDEPNPQSIVSAFKNEVLLGAFAYPFPPLPLPFFPSFSYLDAQANPQACELYKTNKESYMRRVKEEATTYSKREEERKRRNK